MPDSNGKSPEELEAEIAVQRARLAEDVDQLTAKLDVKSRARTQVARLKDSATTADGSPRPEVLAAAGSLVAIAIVLMVWRARR
jgi:hypothetical protein